MDLYYLKGIALAMAAVGIGNAFFEKKELPRIGAIGLVIVALVYVGFVVVWDGGDWLWTELLGVLIYLLPLLFLKKWGSLVVGIGWLLHIAWDVVLHSDLGVTPFVPRGYPELCIGFDLVLALYFLIDYFKPESSIQNT